jgi:hypothetical protein
MLKRTAIVFGCLIVGMQFIPIPRESENGKTRRMHMQEVIDPQVGAILDRSCEDCHSNQTRWPWYSRVAPISWIVHRDVSKGRNKFDFSKWQREPHSANARMEICDSVSDGSMPPGTYTLLHRNARLLDHDVNLICNWASATKAQASAAQISGVTVTAGRWRTSSNVNLTKTKGD